MHDQSFVGMLHRIADGAEQANQRRQVRHMLAAVLIEA